MSKNSSMGPDWQIHQWFNTRESPSLEKLRGQVILLHFFQMLCPGCVSHALPQAQSVHQRLGGSGVRVIGVHSVFEHHEAMTPVALSAFIHEYRLTFPIGVDQPANQGSIPITMDRYQLRGTPSLVLIDREGRVRKHVFGRVDDFDLGLALGSLLREEKTASATTDPGETSEASCGEDVCGLASS